MHPSRTFASRRGSGQAGAISAEYVAAVLVVATVVAALVSLGLPSLVGDWGAYAACRLSGRQDCPGPGEGETARRPEEVNFIPQACVVASTETDDHGTVDALFFELGGNYGYVQEEFADGSVDITFVDKASGGLGVEAGAQGGVRMNGSDFNLGASAEASAVLTGEIGQTWSFDGPNATERAREDIGWLKREKAEDRAAFPIPWFNAAVEALTNEPDLPAPDREFLAGGGGASAKAEASAGFLGAAAEASVDGRLGVEYQLDDAGQRTGTQTWYYQLSGGGSVSASLGPAGVGAAGDKSFVIELDYDQQGTPTQLTMIDTTTTGLDTAILEAEGTSGQAGVKQLAAALEKATIGASGGIAPPA